MSDQNIDYATELLAELIESLTEECHLEDMVNGHNYGFSKALNDLPKEVKDAIQEVLLQECGDVIRLYHGTPDALDSKMCWNENTSFTHDESEACEFSENNDGYIVIANVPVKRIKFYLDGESEFVITAGTLDCEVKTIKEHFGF